MSGLLSSAPSAPAVRLVIGGYLLLLIESALLLLAANLDAHSRMLVWILFPAALACLFAALVGWPASNKGERGRHVR